ncbi:MULTISPECIES: thermonuclease family protein [Bacillus]|uniref:Thermonuclease family protein n=1 Tax=Bacillus cereus (strain Q1) TaxID=361100 RepID=B9J637_BACCQ|nr:MULTISPECIES: thermonuclease family protein [Bacillus]ACM15832.1 thermonuclease family protein [Bacillus cereus Q1]MCB5899832.1 thermonuclease family protein [Bacillus cereus]MCG3791576.1 thermonuclease family protein [Bacillus sp. UTDS19-33BHI26]MDA1663037.1 thermonuclease family protein [Bacillus cereus group sp. TH153LC]MDY7965162.1 thermonuclease family protein [Bacillus thuringiensis]
MKIWIKAICITSFVFQMAACSSSTQTKNDSRPAQAVQNGIQQHVEGKGIVDIPEAYKGKIRGLETVKGKVLHIKDGDTIDVNVKGQKQTVRLLLLDTPESVSQKIPPQKMGKEASSFLKKQLEGKKVTLVYDRGPKEDKFGRKLAYVFCDGIHINELMVKSGYGIIAYISRPNTTFLPEMLEAENKAKESKAGVWSIKGFVDEKNRHYNRNDAA